MALVSSGAPSLGALSESSDDNGGLPNVVLSLPNNDESFLVTRVFNNNKSDTTNQPRLCWYRRSLGATGQLWWPALHIPSVALAHESLIGCFDQERQSKEVHAWTMAFVDEQLQAYEQDEATDCQPTKSNRAVLVLLLSDTQVELMTVPHPNNNNSDNNELYVDLDNFLTEFSPRIMETHKALLRLLKQPTENSEHEQLRNNWKGALRHVKKMMQAAREGTEETTTVSAATNQEDKPAPARVSLAESRSHTKKDPSDGATVVSRTTTATLAVHNKTDGKKDNYNPKDKKSTALALAKKPPNVPSEAVTNSSNQNPQSRNNAQIPEEEIDGPPLHDDDNNKEEEDKQEEAPNHEQQQQQPTEETAPTQTQKTTVDNSDATLQDKDNKPLEHDPVYRSNHDPMYIPPLDVPDFPIRGTWPQVWETLEFSGWTTRLSTCPRGGVKQLYVKPLCQTSVSRPGVGYFTNQFDIQQFCQEMYHWQGPEPEHEEEEEEDAATTATGAGDEEESDEEEEEEHEEEEPVETVVHHHSTNDTVISGLTNHSSLTNHGSGLAVESAASPETPKTRPSSQTTTGSAKSSSTAAFSLGSMTSKDDLHPMLRDKGWHIRKGRGLVDYYYVKPKHNIKKGMEGMDYFTSPEDVFEYLQQQEEYRKKRKAQAPPAQRTKKVLKRTAKSKRVAAATTQSTSTTAKKASNAKNPSQNHTSKPPNRKGSGKSKLLLVRNAKDILQTIGCKVDDTTRQWKFDVKDDGGETTFCFSSLTGLRKFFCNQGIPDTLQAAMKKRVTKKDQNALVQWICFANVPLTSVQIERKLKREYETPKRLDKFLIEENRVQSFNGDLYLPNADRQDRRRKKGRDYFPSDQVDTRFRQALRGVSDCDWPDHDALKTDKRRRDRMTLLLWAATSEAPLPTFDVKAAKEVQAEFESMEELLRNQESSDPEHDEPSVAESSVDTSKSSAASSVASSQASAASHSSASTDKQRVPKWYEPQQQISFKNDVLPILQKLGFQVWGEDNKYGHKDLPPPDLLFEEEQLRTMVAFCGIPTYTPEQQLYPSSRRDRGQPKEQYAQVKLKREERDILLQWANYAHFPKHISPSVQEILDDLERKPMTESQMSEQLVAAGFQISGKFAYPPGSDDHKRRLAVRANHSSPAKRVRGFHQLDNKKELAEFLRSTPNIHLTKKSCRSDKEEVELFLRLWASRRGAQDSLDLPVFSKYSMRWEWLLSQLFPGSGDGGLSDSDTISVFSK